MNKIRSQARVLRKDPTEVERLLWRHNERPVVAGRPLAYPVHRIAFLLSRHIIVSLTMLVDQAHDPANLVYRWIG